MRKIELNKNWSFRCLEEDESRLINLPHDAMQGELRSECNPGGNGISWFAGNDYEYVKTVQLSEEFSDKRIVFEFEGVYKNAEVYINGEMAAYRPYGYTGFLVEAEDRLNFGTENVIKVIARNSDQPNSRWYSGSGIYRPVYMLVMEQKHILPDGLRISTISIHPALISVAVDTNAAGMLQVEILDKGKVIAAVSGWTKGEINFQIEIPDAALWSPTTPSLYECRAVFGKDEYRTSFGIRSLSWNRVNGFEINGNRVILKGACIHHDNGLLGACSYEDAERRKVKLLMDVGYNAIRSAHNPCSCALLKACDELGMLVLDEYTDMWYIHKNRYDYADNFSEWWMTDLKDMVRKDYNHPCVILYSTGNEVAETAQERGISLTKEMTEYLHALDATRPVTCGINIFFNFLSSVGLGIYSDKKAIKQTDEIRKHRKTKSKPVGSEFYNKLAGIFGDKAMKIGATLHGCDIKTRDAYVGMDIAGYNYGILRYKKDLIRYPERLILGTETFCKDAYTFMELAKKQPGIIGDFVWAGMDYLGEAGIGAWEYDEYVPEKADTAGWLTAGSGRIDITGRKSGEAAYTSVAFEKTKGPIIAVRPLHKNTKHSPSAWKMTDAMESWTWTGCEGMTAKIEVYARGEWVRLSINERIIAKKKLGNGCRAVFSAPYQKGMVTAEVFDAENQLIGCCSLKTAKEETILQVIPEEDTVRPNGLCYLRIRYSDQEGTCKPLEYHTVSIEVEGGALLGLGHACAYNPLGYGENHTETYYGEALAVVLAEAMSSEILVRVMDAERNVQITVPVRHINEREMEFL